MHSILFQKIFCFFKWCYNSFSGHLSRCPTRFSNWTIIVCVHQNAAPKLSKIEESIFADDKLLYTSSYRVSAIVKRLQQALKVHRRYFHKWKIKINNSKTEAILFTKRRPQIKDNIFSENIQLNWLNKVKYLGIILDQKLNFGDHINYVISKSIASLIKFYPIFKNVYFSKKIKLILYKSLIRTAMLYACPVWSLTSQSNMNKLQIVQNKFLRIIGKYREFSLISQMHQDLNIEYVKEYIHRLTVKYFERIKTHPNPLVKNIIYDTNKIYRHRKFKQVLLHSDFFLTFPR